MRLKIIPVLAVLILQDLFQIWGPGIAKEN